MSTARFSSTPAFPMFKFLKSSTKAGLQRLGEKNEFSRNPPREQAIRYRPKCSSRFVHGDRVVRPERSALCFTHSTTDREFRGRSWRAVDSFCCGFTSSRDPKCARAKIQRRINSKRPLQISTASDLHRNYFVRGRSLSANADNLDRTREPHCRCVLVSQSGVRRKPAPGQVRRVYRIPCAN